MAPRVGGEAQVAAGGEGCAERQMGRRNRAQRLDNFLQAVASQRAIDQECTQTEHRHANPGIQALKEGRFVTHLPAGLSNEFAELNVQDGGPAARGRD
jgi:hypothetical protein